MKYAILSDIHSNLEALQAVLKDAKGHHCTHYACLGDVVGYNANPHECIDIIRNLQCPVILGNHDEYCSMDIGEDQADFNPLARMAIDWTRDRLSKEDKEWLKHRPYSLVVDGFTMVHGTMLHPHSWDYVFDRSEARWSLEKQDTKIGFHGHTHKPTAFIQDNKQATTNKYRSVIQESFKNLEIKDGFKYFINTGSVGQPRDLNPKASYVIYDVPKGIVTLRRVEYDIPAVQKKIRDAGLPEILAERLEIGR